MEILMKGPYKDADIPLVPAFPERAF